MSPSTSGTSAAVLISGGGTNLQAFIDSTASGDLDLELKLVLSNKPGAAGLDRARKAAEFQITAAVLSRRQVVEVGQVSAS